MWLELLLWPPAAVGYANWWTKYGSIGRVGVSKFDLEYCCKTTSSDVEPGKEDLGEYQIVFRKNYYYPAQTE